MASHDQPPHPELGQSPNPYAPTTATEAARIVSPPPEGDTGSHAANAETARVSLVSSTVAPAPPAVTMPPRLVPTAASPSALAPAPLPPAPPPAAFISPRPMPLSSPSSQRDPFEDKSSEEAAPESRGPPRSRSASNHLLRGESGHSVRRPPINTRASRRQSLPFVELENVPTIQEHEHPSLLTLRDRLKPTIEAADAQRQKSERQAYISRWLLNIAIMGQVLVGSLTTGIAAALAGNKKAGFATSVLGAISTVIASFLATSRASGEPEASVARVKDLEHFLRDCNAFAMDYGECITRAHDDELFKLRGRFETLLGNFDRKDKEVRNDKDREKDPTPPV